MKIAIIGSGIGGLSCAWYLSQEHEVTLYEAHDRLGMGAHAVEVPDFSSPNNGNGVLVDMPMRVFFPEYYPTLSSLYKEADIATESLEYSASFCRLGGDLLFRYRNYLIGGVSLPFLHGRDLTRFSTARIGIKLLSFLVRLPKLSEENQKHYSHETLGEFIERAKVPKEVANEFLLPAYTGICTCSYENLLNYPARIILNYLNSGLILSSMQRATLGVDDVVTRLSKQVAKIKLSAPIKSVSMEGQGVEVQSQCGEKSRFDHVVIATQADHAVDILQGEVFEQERQVLSAFDYEGFDVVIHKDDRLAPANPSWRAPVNYLLAENTRAPMATIPLNSVHKDLSPDVTIYQTWNPLIEPKGEDIFKSIKLFRPLINENSAKAQQQISRLHSEPNRKVWLCGSYASPGIPLQESAAVSAKHIAHQLSQRSSWAPNSSRISYDAA